ncbi:MAG: acyl CoA:acetate/3-ketoacid CoA transferase [Spirochaetaceae bacterium]|nr:MAG: acyl CoA:acetate/3-ketoacid CoA transferase [Spirochaetaceae bacterium]
MNNAAASRTKIISAERAAELITDNAVVSVSSSSGLGCPDSVLSALGRRFRQTGSPRNLTTIHPIAAGDMYGIDGIDHLAQEGLLARVIAGSYPSGPSNRQSPRIWQMIRDNTVAAYNVPSGVLFDMHRDVAAHRPGVLTMVGMDTFVDPRRNGCRMNDAAVEDIVELVDFAGCKWLHFRNFAPDCTIIRGTTADERGNISMEHEGAYLGVIEQALAARNNGGIIIAQVKRITEAFSIPAQRAYVPSTLVDYVVVAPDQMQTTETLYDPAISGEVRTPISFFEPVPESIEKIIARRAALELAAGDTVNLGFGISALVPRVLIEEGAAGRVTWAIEQGATGGVPLTGFAFGCAVNAEAILASPYQFTLFQGGGIDAALLSFMQVDSQGCVNVSRLAAMPHVTAGCGGFVDIVTAVRRIVFCGTFTAGGLDVRIDDGQLNIVRDGKVNKFVPQVEHVTFSGNQGLARRQDVTYVTERCVIKLRPEGLTVTEIAPGIDLQAHVLQRSDAPLRVARELKPMDERLFRSGAVGLYGDA